MAYINGKEILFSPRVGKDGSLYELLNRTITKVEIPPEVGTIPAGAVDAVVANAAGIIPYMFCGCTKLNTVINNSAQAFIIGGYAFRYTIIESFDFKNVTRIGEHAFHNTYKLKTIKNFDGVTHIGVGAFISSGIEGQIVFPETLKEIDNTAFGYNNITSVIFKGKPTKISGVAFAANPEITDIYVPWASGAVSAAPWGATNATIHYNFK